MLQSITFQSNNSKNFSIWGWNLICSLEYIVKDILQWKMFNTLRYSDPPRVKFLRISSKYISRKLLPLESVSLIQKHKSYEIFSNGHVDQSLLNLCTKFLGFREITGRRRPYICKWTILQVSLILMQLIMELTNYAIN